MSQVSRLWFQVLWTSGCHLARGVKSLPVVATYGTAPRKGTAVAASADTRWSSSREELDGENRTSRNQSSAMPVEDGSKFKSPRTNPCSIGRRTKYHNAPASWRFNPVSPHLSGHDAACAVRTDGLWESGLNADSAHAAGRASPLLIAYRPPEPSSNHRPWLCLCLCFCLCLCLRLD